MIPWGGHPVSGIAALAAAVLFAIVIVLQILLAAGVLPVTMAWGGRQSVLTPKLRLASLGAALVLVGMAYVILRRAGLLVEAPVTLAIKILSWVVTAYLALNTMGNLTSPSKLERGLFGSLTALLVICCAVVSLAQV